jgi:hypothetical protein
MVEEVLPDVDYAQIIFTIPKMLRKAFLFNRSLVGELCRVAYEAIRMFFTEHFPKLEDPVPAVIIAPQSFGSLLNVHLHLHTLISIGVFDRHGNFHPTPDLDFSPLEKIFQELTFKMMLKQEAVTEERVALLQSWQHSGFHIDASRRVAQGHRDELERLLQYFERPPVSLERLSYFADGRVLYRGGKFHPGLGRDHQLVSGVEFLAMLVPHILLRYECSVRYYGAISTTIRRKFGWIKKRKIQAPQNVPVIEGEESEFVRVRKRNWARLIKKVWLEDPSLCPRCGKPLEIIAAISAPAQDEIIEKILKAKNLWDPPWLQNRPARGPPSSTPAAPPSPGTDRTNEWMDPPHQDYPDEQYPDEE